MGLIFPLSVASVDVKAAPMSPPSVPSYCGCLGSSFALAPNWPVLKGAFSTCIKVQDFINCGVLDFSHPHLGTKLTSRWSFQAQPTSQGCRRSIAAGVWGLRTRAAPGSLERRVGLKGRKRSAGLAHLDSLPLWPARSQGKTAFRTA